MQLPRVPVLLPRYPYYYPGFSRAIICGGYPYYTDTTRAIVCIWYPYYY